MDSSSSSLLSMSSSYIPPIAPPEGGGQDGYDFLSLRRAFPGPQIDESKALDWTGCLTRVADQPVFVGKYSELFRAEWRPCSVPSATLPAIVMKDIRMLPDEFHDARMLKKKRMRLKQEVDVWQRVRHVNVLPFVGIALFPARLPSLIFIYMEKGTVKQYIRRTPGVNRLEIVRGVTSGLKYLHSFDLAIIHGDMKADNVLVDDEGNPRLADFGLSRVKGEITMHTTNRCHAPGTTRWMAPELLKHQLSVTTEADVWAYAMTCMEIMTGQVPFPKLNEPGVILAVAGKGEIPEQPLEIFVPTELWSIWISCWSIEPEDRPSMFELHELFEDFMKNTQFDATIPLPPEKPLDDAEQLLNSTLVSPQPLAIESNPKSNPDLPDFAAAELPYDFGRLWQILMNIKKQDTSAQNVDSPTVQGTLNWTQYLRKMEDRLVGWGGFCDIYQTEWANLHETVVPHPPIVVMKICRLALLDEVRTNRMTKAVLRQLRVWQQLTHRNVLPLLGIAMGNGLFPAAISPLMLNGESVAFFRQNPHRSKAEFLRQLACGLEYLHYHMPPIIHGGIKGSNVLVDENGSPRLSGFALSRQLDEITTSTLMGGYVRWMAPELIFGEETRVTIASDVYSYAAASLEIITGEVPFSQQRMDSQVIVLVVVEGQRPTKPFLDDASQRVEDLRNRYKQQPLSERRPRHQLMEEVDAIWAREEAETELWKLWEGCWAQDSRARPNMRTVVERMAEIVALGSSL